MSVALYEAANLDRSRTCKQKQQNWKNLAEPRVPYRGLRETCRLSRSRIVRQTSRFGSSGAYYVLTRWT